MTTAKKPCVVGDFVAAPGTGPVVVRTTSAGYCSDTIEIRGEPVTQPEQQLTFGQKIKLGAQAAKAFARNPKALVALVKYKLAERKSAKEAR